MLKKLQILNFQKHKRLRIDLDPQITAIVGESDTGKSSIIRSLRWLSMNRPRGDSFVREGAKNASVRLQVDEHDIARRRGSKGNSYVLDGNELKAFGTDVPDQITNVLNVDEVNYQLQHQPPYWFTLTAGEVAKELNKIVDLEVIDTVVSNVASRLRKAKTEVEVVKNRLDKIKTKQNELKYVPQVANELKELEKSQEIKFSLDTRVSALGALKVEAGKLAEKIKNAEEIISNGLMVIERGSVCTTASDQVNELNELIEKVKEAKSKTEAEVPDLNELNELKEEVLNKRARLKIVADIVSDIRGRMNQLELTREALLESKDMLGEFVGEVCPVCGGVLSILF